jgi:hypothetical protein
MVDRVTQYAELEACAEDCRKALSDMVKMIPEEMLLAVVLDVQVAIQKRQWPAMKISCPIVLNAAILSLCETIAKMQREREAGAN